jgi:hypothetical protein
VTVTIEFRSWVRPATSGLVTGVEQGRARAATDVTLTAQDATGATTGTDTATLSFLLAGPPDVSGLQPGAVRRRFPAPGTIDAEPTKCPYVELADASLPWRYTPAANPGPGDPPLRPWLVLLVGTDAELQVTGDQVALDATVRGAHPLADSARWAHVQGNDGQQVARLLSARPLAADVDYLAVLVPAFSTSTSGPPKDAWTATGTALVPVYDSWRFRTGPAGDFPALARRLQPGAADPGTGRAPLRYPRLANAAPLAVRGALAPLRSTDTDLPAGVAADLAGLVHPPPDPRGRTVVGLPRYGAAWRDDPETTTWGQMLNRDPRHRGVAGLGLNVGVTRQDQLVGEATKRAGALTVAAQRIRELTLGLAASGGLWTRRFPTDPHRRLWLLGPALRRVVTDNGTVAELATAADRALPRGVFSSAVRRILRPGPARTALAARGAADPAAVLAAANRCRDADTVIGVGIPLGTLAPDFIKRVRQAVKAGTGDVNALLAAYARARSLLPADAETIDAVVRRIQLLVAGGQPLPWSTLACLLAALLARRRDQAEVARLSGAILEGQVPADDVADLGGLLGSLVGPAGASPPCRPVDLDAVAAAVAAAFDPTVPDSAARTRVLGLFDGLDAAAPTAPPAFCPGIDLPAWRSLNQLAPDWLLPGVGTLADDVVIALQTNPAFVDAFLVGLNPVPRRAALAQHPGRWRLHPDAGLLGPRGHRRRRAGRRRARRGRLDYRERPRRRPAPARRRGRRRPGAGVSRAAVPALSAHPALPHLRRARGGAGLRRRPAGQRTAPAADFSGADRRRRDLLWVPGRPRRRHRALLDGA